MTSPFSPPLIPLPPNTSDKRTAPASDPNDLFESLFTTEDTLFQSHQHYNERLGSVSSPVDSDFGAFVSVPASEVVQGHPLLDFLDESPPPSEAKPKVSDFFHRVAEEAKKNNERNEERVVNTILKYEQNPTLLLESSRHSNSPLSFIHQEQSVPPRTMEHPHSNTISHSPSNQAAWKAPMIQDCDHSTDASTPVLPRKWMSSLLTASVSSLPYTLKHDSSKSLPNKKIISPPVTHASPFAPHTIVPPSGAPGFTGDYSWNQGGFEFDESDRNLRRLRLEGRKESTSPVLKSGLAEQIRASLPALPRLAKSWTLLYSLDQHGVSLQTLFSRCASRVSSTLLVIQDSDDCVFGVWLSGTIHVSPGYYGTGDSFLWRSTDQGIVETFKWTGKNDYVALCEKEYISFGGGTGKYGLYLNENLTDGSSAPSPTFDNPVLSGSGAHDGRDVTVNFECVGVEIWGISN